MTEEYEQALFLNYRLDPARVRFLRARLKNAAPYPMKELERKRRRYLSLCKKIQILAEQTKQISREVGCLRVHCPWVDGFDFCYSRPDGLQWDLIDKQWGEGVECTDAVEAFKKYVTIKTEYRQRPDEKQAIKVWDSFVVAARSAPEVMIRERGRGFRAAFRDSRNRVVTLHYEFIQQQKAAKPAVSGV